MIDYRIYRKAMLTLAVMAGAVAPAPLLAQQADTVARAAPITTAALADAGVVSAVALPSVTTIAHLQEPVGPQVASARWMPVRSAEVALQDRPHAGRDVAMMGVGAAGIVVGLLIGGDSGMIIATGSGIIGLVGLYNYLK